MSFLLPEEEYQYHDDAAECLEDKEKPKEELNRPDWKIPEVEPIDKILVSRRDWGAGPHIEGHRYLGKPILHIRFWKYTETESCIDKEMCKKLVKDIQERHKAKGFGDITHNFLLGGDGNIYEGRGWDYKAPQDTRYKFNNFNYLDVAFIGDERRIYQLYEVAFELLERGFQNNYIDKKYYQVEWGSEPLDLSMKRLT